MATIKVLYGTTNQAITITLASLANAAAQSSAAVDNTTNLFLDALVSLTVKSGASGTSATGSVAIYAYGTVDNGTTYSDGVTGSDAAFTPTSPANLRLIGLVNVVTNAATYLAGPFSVAAAFGGTLPAKWGIVVVNNAGATLDTTGANFAATYQGIQAQTV